VVKKDNGLANSVKVSGQTRRDDVAEHLRQDAVLVQLRRMTKKHPVFQTDFDAVQSELTVINMRSNKLFREKTLALGSRSSLELIAQARLRIQAERDRCVEILNEMRTVNTLSDELYTTGSSYIRQQPMMKGFTADATSNIIDVALRELTSCWNNSELIIAQGQEVTRNLDAKTRALDTWLGIYREYVFVSGSQAGSQDGSRDKFTKRRLSA
jgi:hypothetical protein